MLLVNARHLKQVPGRKSDIRDCQWIAQLLQYGLLKGSFIPPHPQRELRDLTRHRARLVEEKTRTINRLHKALEDANIKLSAVAADTLGVSGRATIQRLIEGETDPHKLADLALGQLRGKIPELEKALRGRVTEHHQFLLRMLWQQLAQQEAWIAEVEAQIQERTRPFAAEIQRLDGVLGVNHQVAEVLLAEVGSDMSPFPRIGTWRLGPGCARATKRAPASVEENASRQAIAGSKRLWCKPAGRPRTPGTAILPLSIGAWPDVAVRSALWWPWDIPSCVEKKRD